MVQILKIQIMGDIEQIWFWEKMPISLPTTEQEHKEIIQNHLQQLISDTNGKSQRTT